MRRVFWGLHRVGPRRTSLDRSHLVLSQMQDWGSAIPHYIVGFSEQASGMPSRGAGSDKSAVEPMAAIAMDGRSCTLHNLASCCKPYDQALAEVGEGDLHSERNLVAGAQRGMAAA